MLFWFKDRDSRRLNETEIKYKYEPENEDNRSPLTHTVYDRSRHGQMTEFT